MKHGNIAVFVPHLGCPNRCSFCDQNLITSSEKMLPTALEIENICRAALERADKKELELAFFGGSFTAIAPDVMRGLLACARPFCGPGGISGIRVSTRPDAIDQDRLDILKEYNVTAVELGAQSMDDEVLLKNRRGHLASHVEQAARLIRQNGLSLALQMMVGLDGEKPGGSLETARRLAALKPDAVRIYPVLVMKNTELDRQRLAGSYSPLSLEEAVEETSAIMQFFLDSGIKILKVGLHSDAAMQGSIAAGPWHPAFRELCEGEMMLRRLLQQLSALPPGPITVAVHPKDVSRLAGHAGANKKRLHDMGWSIKMQKCPDLPRLSPRLLTTEV